MMVVLVIALQVVVLGLFVASAWYVAYRLRTLFGVTRCWPLRIGAAVALFGSGTLMLAVARSSNALVGLLSTVGGYLFGFYLYLLLALLVAHAVQWKVRLPGRWVALGALGVAFATTLAGALWAEGLRLNEQELTLPGLRQEVVLMHISDVHIGHQRGRSRLQRIVDETNRRTPDLVVLNGDLVDSNAALEPGVLEPLSGFDAPVFFVGGNHDGYVDAERALELIEAQGVRVLHNEVVRLNGLQLVGLDYMNPDDAVVAMHPSKDKRTIRSELPTLNIDQDTPAVLAHHSPVGTQYVAAAGVELMLAGHTHAGQMFPATVFAPLFFPFNAGLYRTQGGLQVFVSQGAGTFGPRLRLGSSNEIDLFRLRPGKP